MSWQALEADAPELAREGRARFESTGVALLGTIRVDGTPLISLVEPFLLDGRLVFGVLTSPKWDDIRRDPRVALHSSVRDGSGSEGEFKVYGRAVATDDPALITYADAWWSSRPREKFEVYEVEISEAVLVAWDTQFNKMRTRSWAPGAGARENVRSYP